MAAAALACLAAATGCAPVAPTEIQLHRMGERVTAGSLVYNVFEDQWKAQLGQGADARVPKDRFFLIRLSVVNGGSTELMVPTLTLLDDAGQTYAELSTAETLQGNVVFDVPPKHYRLRVADETSQKLHDIDIPLNFASETPDMPTPQ
jgi:hypothetical protein